MNAPASNGAPGLLLLGLDGATLDLMRPWAAEGKLPHMAALMGEGSTVELRSTVPPITPPAWTSMFTGRNPGKHRIFDFAEPDPDNYQLHYLNGGHVQGPNLWTLLNRAGRRATIMNVPMTYPAREMDGIMISGLDAPDETCAFTWPGNVYKELCDSVGGYRIDIRHLGNMRDDQRRDETLQAFIELERQRGEAALHLLRTQPNDFQFIVFNATDQVQHHFWHYMDPEHPRYDAAGAERYGDAILQVYQEVDRQIGRLVDAAGPDVPVAIVSDHGCGASGDTAFHVNQYLAECGFLNFRSEASAGVISGVAKGVDGFLRRTLSSEAKSKLAKMFPGARASLETMATSPVDWSKTRAFVQEAYLSSPNIWVNREGRFGEGCVSEADYASLVRDIKQALLEAKRPGSNAPLMDRVYLRDEVFQGPFADQAPDIVLPWWDDDAFAARASSHADVGQGSAIHKETEPLRGGLDFVADHRMEGILILARGPFAAGAEMDASLLDIAPTVLHLFGVPVPRDMDGRVLTEAFAPGYLQDHPVRFDDHEEELVASMEAYSEEEERKIRERLQGIGYLE